jgi:hypothetical protein
MADAQNIVDYRYRRIAEERFKQTVSVASLLLEYCSELLTRQAFKMPTMDGVLGPIGL